MVMKFQRISLVNGDPACKRTVGDIVNALPVVILLYFYAFYQSLGLLGYHQTQQTAATTYIQDVFNIQVPDIIGNPGAKEAGIGSYLHAALVMVDRKLLKPEIGIAQGGSNE